MPRVFAVESSSSARFGVDDGETIRGLRVSRRSFAEVAGLLTAWAGERDRMRYFACLNAHSAEVAHRDASFMAALQQADLLVADGFGVVLASRILGGRIRERATGPDLFVAVSEALNRGGDRSVFYLGGSAETLARIRVQHEKRFPGLRIAGMHAPPFRTAFAEDELAAMVDRVNDARPDVLWIGLGAPKQEKWILAARDRLRVPLCGPVGAVFDYFSGNVAPPPRWIEKVGLHWAYRLLRNPRRLWRRNLDSPLFLAHVLADRLRRGRGNAPAGPLGSAS
jgi:N-acetylglucosaminyldiphosphoundecaprenol N-acetyl-beta-D-mannosaminyltransferase